MVAGKRRLRQAVEWLLKEGANPELRNRPVWHADNSPEANLRAIRGEAAYEYCLRIVGEGSGVKHDQGAAILELLRAEREKRVKEAPELLAAVIGEARTPNPMLTQGRLVGEDVVCRMSMPN